MLFELVDINFANYRFSVASRSDWFLIRRRQFMGRGETRRKV